MYLMLKVKLNKFISGIVDDENTDGISCRYYIPLRPKQFVKICYADVCTALVGADIPSFL